MSGARPPAKRDADQATTQLQDVGDPQNTGDRVDPADDAGGIREVVDSEIIPRLLLLHANRVELQDPDYTPPDVDAARIREFARLAIEHEVATCCSYIETLRSEGYTADRLLMELLAPAAQQLGVWWEEDKVDFVDVTIGTSRLHQIVHRLRKDAARRRVETRAPRILLLPAPGEQHTFGLLLISEHFLSHGWDVCGGYPLEVDEAQEMIGAEHWDFIGYSLANDRLISDLGQAISSARKAAFNSRIKFIVGGHAFATDPSLQSRVGADFVASSPADALKLCETSFARQVDH